MIEHQFSITEHQQQKLIVRRNRQRFNTPLFGWLKAVTAVLCSYPDNGKFVAASPHPAVDALNRCAAGGASAEG